MSWLLDFWYIRKHPLRYLFYPFHFLLLLLVKARQILYKIGLFQSHKISVPVIIVGNITVGGTGKSPLVIYLAEQLTLAGYKPGILSRGYGGNAGHYPLLVTSDSLPAVVGDEPVMLQQRNKAVVVVDPQRARGANYLISEQGCDLIICDDGLQHYALQRDIEILVVDGQRNFGNGLLMPFGPLREPVSRAKDVDALVINTGSSLLHSELPEQFVMQLTSSCFVSLIDDTKILDINDMLRQCNLDNAPIHAVAGIGNPFRFFEQLEKQGLSTVNHSFNDHHSYNVEDFNTMNGIIIMTEKDAVKCREFATDNMWYLKVNAEITPSIVQYCLSLLQNLKREN